MLNNLSDDEENATLIKIWNKKASGELLSRGDMVHFYKLCHKRFRPIFYNFKANNEKVCELLNITYEDAVADFFTLKFMKERLPSIKDGWFSYLYRAFNNMLLDQYARNKIARDTEYSLNDDKFSQDRNNDLSSNGSSPGDLDDDDDNSDNDNNLNSTISLPANTVEFSSTLSFLQQRIADTYGAFPNYIKTIIAYNLCREKMTDKLPVSKINEYFRNINSHAYFCKKWGVSGIKNLSPSDFFTKTELGKHLKEIMLEIKVHQPEQSPEILLDLLKILCLHASKYMDTQIEKDLKP